MTHKMNLLQILNFEFRIWISILEATLFIGLFNWGGASNLKFFNSSSSLQIQNFSWFCDHMSCALIKIFILDMKRLSEGL